MSAFAQTRYASRSFVQTRMAGLPFTPRQRTFGGLGFNFGEYGNAPADLAALLGDAEKLNEVREFHRNWGDQDTDTLDGLDLWEQLGRLLGVTP